MLHSVWITAHLSRESELNVRKLFRETLGFPSEVIKRGLHVTVYHARRHLPGLADSTEPLSINIPSVELRMMAMAPGGENPRPDINPLRCMIGLRIRRSAGATEQLEAIRSRFYAYEQGNVLGSRLPSNRRRSAFGARSYQPHITVLKADAVNDPDLSKIGRIVRNQLEDIHLDRLIIRCKLRERSP